MSLTTEQYRALADVKRALVRRGWSPAAVGQAVLRAADRVAPGGMGSCGTNCCCCRGSGVGDTAAAAPAGSTPAILAQISAAGSDPTVSSMRDIVGKWSWLIPVGGLLMNVKSKIGSAISGKNDPSLSIARAGRSRR